ncbi:MAG: PAS domain-containing protein [Thalassobaculaceae bacterium]|nr:PAS domain-containing protein [Thalassobaculaceae bacterium]
MKLFRWCAPSRSAREVRRHPLHLQKNASARLDSAGGDLNPQAARLISFWHANRLETGLPDRQSFDPSCMTEWLGYISIYEYEPAKDDFRNRLEGSYVADLTGENWTGHYASEVDMRFGARFLRDLKETRVQRVPLVDLVQIFQNDYGVALRVMLPVSRRSGREADQIFVAIFAGGVGQPAVA